MSWIMLSLDFFQEFYFWFQRGNESASAQHQMRQGRMWGNQSWVKWLLVVHNDRRLLIGPQDVKWPYGIVF